jgi:hypothetical protein
MMANFRMNRLANVRIFVGLLISSVLAAAMCAQGRPKLQIEVGSNQEITILASDVSYGEILRALQTKLGWEIEIPALADELKVSEVHIGSTQPQTALAQLLEGRRLDYAMLGGNKSQKVRVIVIPSRPRDAKVTDDAASSSPISNNAVAGTQSSIPAQEQAVTTIEPNDAEVRADARPLGGLSTVPLSEAINAMGVPPGMSPTDVGNTVTLPISEAARMMGVPPGISTTDVGSTIKLSISDAARMIGVPPGVSQGDVGKPISSPLPTGSGKRP